MIMLALLLYTHTESPWLIPLMWGIGTLCLVFLVVMLYVQRRTGRRLKDELAELDKAAQGNVEYEFVLKAMKLSTWHIDPKRRTVTCDTDFREGQGNYLPAPDTPLAHFEEAADLCPQSQSYSFRW